MKNNEQDRMHEQSANRYHALGAVGDEENEKEEVHAQDFTRLGDELI